VLAAGSKHRGRDPDSFPDNWQVLAAALLDAGADVNAADSDGMTAVMLAAEAGQGPPPPHTHTQTHTERDTERKNRCQYRE